MPEPVGRAAVRADAEAAADGAPEAVAVTAARALVLGSALSTPLALSGLEADIAAIGIARVPGHWGSWKSRTEVCDASDGILRSYGLLDDVRQREDSPLIEGDASETVPSRPARVDLWRRVAVSGDRAEAVAWLRAVMTDREPIAAAAAANALAAWRRSGDAEIPRALSAARTLLDAHAATEVSGAQDIAIAGLASITNAESGLGQGENVEAEAFRKPEHFIAKSRPAKVTSREDGTASTIVHGTRTWAGNWWYVGGDFHSYVLRSVRPDLFCKRNAFSWDGAYRKRHRAIAAERLAGWAHDTVGGSLNAVFAHSYGGTIALHATAHGLKVRDLILLSAPVEEVPVEWRNIERAQSLRIHMDLVLLAARRRQRFTENVSEHHLPQWFWEHGDTHDPDVWQAHECSKLLNL